MLSDYASIAEIISSLVVILSLLFVGFQIKESNRHARAMAIQDALKSEQETSAQYAQHYETWDKLITGQAIEGPELRKANQLLNILLTETENRYHQYKQGYLLDQTWDARLKSLEFTISLPLYKSWRDSVAGMHHSADFLVLLDDIDRKVNGQKE